MTTDDEMAQLAEDIARRLNARLADGDVPPSASRINELRALVRVLPARGPLTSAPCITVDGSPTDGSAVSLTRCALQLVDSGRIVPWRPL